MGKAAPKVPVNQLEEDFGIEALGKERGKENMSAMLLDSQAISPGRVRQKAKEEARATREVQEKVVPHQGPANSVEVTIGTATARTKTGQELQVDGIKSVLAHRRDGPKKARMLRKAHQCGCRKVEEKAAIMEKAKAYMKLGLEYRQEYTARDLDKIGVLLKESHHNQIMRMGMCKKCAH